jgi:tight adherence protein B
MILGCLVLAVGAVLLFTAPPPARHVRTRLKGTDRRRLPRPEARHRAWVRWVALGCAVVVLLGAHGFGGPPAVAVSGAALIMIGTCTQLLVQAMERRRAAAARVEVAHACSVLAAQIRVGRVPAAALASAAGDCPVLVDSSRTQDLGGDPADSWRQAARSAGHAGLGDLARAWQVSAQTGAPLARSLEQVSKALAADVALRTVVAGELSATRATGKIMAVLPFCGLGMGYLLGGDPLHFLLTSSYGWVCLVAGVALAAGGVLWIDRLSRLAEEQGPSR